MPRTKSRKKRPPKRVLALPDLEQAKTAVLNSLTSTSGQRTYDHAIHEFVAWYCSEPRLAFNRTVVLRYRIHLEQRHYAPATINLRLAAVRRVAYEAADAGLLSPELAAGIRRVKGVRRLGVRLGNWLTPEQGRRLLTRRTPPRCASCATMRCSPCSSAAASGEANCWPSTRAVQQREEHWVIADLVGKGGHVRTVPMPSWVKTAVDAWTAAAGITEGTVFRAINKAGRVWGDGMTREGPVGRRPHGRCPCWHREAGSARPPPDLRPAVPPRRRRTGPDSVPARARLDPDDGTVPRVQAEASMCGE